MKKPLKQYAGHEPLKIFLKIAGGSALASTGVRIKVYLLILAMNLETFLTDYCLIFLAGVAGAFIADIIKDNCVIFPKKSGDLLNLGIFGALLIGGIAGLLIDGSPVTAFMGGFMGREFIKRFAVKNGAYSDDDNLP